MSSINTNCMLALTDLSVSFDGFKAVDDLSLYVDCLLYTSDAADE